MPVQTIYRLAQQAHKLIQGADPAAAQPLTINTLKISCGQVINQLLKTEYFSILNDDERIPDGLVIALYEGIAVTKNGNRSYCTLPIMPMRLPRDIGVFSVWKTGDPPEEEFIPLQMGQAGLLKSQPMINDLLGQVGRERFGMRVEFTKDITIPGENVTVDMRLVIMDINQLDDYDPLPILPEHEWLVITEVFKMYSQQPVPDKLVDSSVKEQKGVPIKQQSQG